MSSGSAAYRVVQPWGRDRGRECTVQSEHKTLSDAFAAVDALAARMAATGAPSDAVEFVVINSDGDVVDVVQRPSTH
jgi:hypothetical protein